MQKNYTALVLILFIFSLNPVYAQPLFNTNALVLDSELGNGQVSFFPSFTTGSHVNTIAYNARALDLYKREEFGGKQRDFTFSPFASAHYFERKLGISGTSTELRFGGEAIYSYGRKINSNTPFSNRNISRRWAFSYYLLYYWSDDNTSQISGALGIHSRREKDITSFVFENDILGGRGRDEFRTIAFDITHTHKFSKRWVGFGTNLTLWTGTTNGLGSRNRNEIYDLTNQFGGQFSNGVLSFKVTVDNVAFSIGYDSEHIRDFFQNNFHYLINDGKIPRLEDRDDRFFFSISLLNFGFY